MRLIVNGEINSIYEMASDVIDEFSGRTYDNSITLISWLIAVVKINKYGIKFNDEEIVELKNELDMNEWQIEELGREIEMEVRRILNIR